MRLRTRRWLGALLALAVLGGAGAWAFVRFGAYDISANRQHTQAVYTLLERTMHHSVRRRADAIEPPALEVPALVARGGTCYVQKCLQCHGGPGVAQAEIGRAMQPLPGPLVDARGKWSAAELYWITRNGIKMSGMPAWQHHLHDADIWAVVAFMQRLPDLTTAQFRTVVETPGRCSTSDDPNGAGDLGSSSTSGRSARSDTFATAGGSATPAASTVPAPSVAIANDGPDTAVDRGRRAMTQYACSACHRIPGVTGAAVDVGPPLAGFANRRTIAGAIGNDAGQLARWIRDPQAVDPKTTMPNLRVGERDAADMAAYLLTLR